MAYKRIRDLPQLTEPLCVHLRTKEMIVKGILDAKELDAHHTHHACWCNLTQRPMGPDSRAVELLGCTSGRTCFSATR